jgi:hypothetical protein
LRQQRQSRQCCPWQWVSRRSSHACWDGVSPLLQALLTVLTQTSPPRHFWNSAMGEGRQALRALPLLPVRAAATAMAGSPQLTEVFCNALCCLAALKNSTEIAQAGRVLMPRRQLGTQTSIARPASMVFTAPARGGSRNLLSPLPASAAELMLDSLARSGWLFCRWNKTQH